jgi:hypothetical protein
MSFSGVANTDGTRATRVGDVNVAKACRGAIDFTLVGLF